MGYKKTAKYFTSRNPWERRIMLGVPEDEIPVGLKVLFVKAHPNTSGFVKGFVGQVGKVLSHSNYPWEGTKWCVRFGHDSLWLRPRYLKVLSEDQES